MISQILLQQSNWVMNVAESFLIHNTLHFTLYKHVYMIISRKFYFVIKDYSENDLLVISHFLANFVLLLKQGQVAMKHTD